MTLLSSAIGIAGCENSGNQAPPAAQIQQPAPQQPHLPTNKIPLETLKASLFDDPDNPKLLAALGDAYFEQRRFKEAIPVYEKAVGISPQDTDTLNDLGLSYFYTGNPDAALTTLNKATSADPNYKFAWLSTGYVLVSLGRYDEAVAPLTRAKELDPSGIIGQEADGFLRKIEELEAKGLVNKAN
jgi:tetratricopeptide (TPR) repeat protein